MKIAVVSNDEKTIFSHFGMSKGFVIFEVEGQEIKGRDYRPNTFTNHAEYGGHQGESHHGEGHGSHRHGEIINALSDCQVVISGGMGGGMYNNLVEAGIKTYITGETDVEKAVKLYLEGKLQNDSEGCCDH